MIYLRLHQVGIEEVEAEPSRNQAGASRRNWGNFAIVAKFRYNSEIFAIIAKFH